MFFCFAIFVRLRIRLQSIRFYAINLMNNKIIRRNEKLDQMEKAITLARPKCATPAPAGTGQKLTSTCASSPKSCLEPQTYSVYLRLKRGEHFHYISPVLFWPPSERFYWYRSTRPTESVSHGKG